MAFIPVLLLLAFTIGTAFYVILTNDYVWSDVSLDLLASPSNKLIPGFYLLIFRISAMFAILSVCILIYVDSPLQLDILTRDGVLKRVSIEKLQRFSTFTVWSWCLQGIYFILASICSIDFLYDTSLLSPAVRSVTMVLYEVSFSMSFLVTIIVTFILIPSGIKTGQQTDVFFGFASLCMHNLNVILMSIESILSNLSFNLWHIPFVILYGCSYVIFSWYWYKLNGVFYYFFLDFGRKYAVWWHLGLIFMVSLSIESK